jgi:hypothetical protein
MGAMLDLALINSEEMFRRDYQVINASYLERGDQADLYVTLIPFTLMPHTSATFWITHRVKIASYQQQSAIGFLFSNCWLPVLLT